MLYIPFSTQSSWWSSPVNGMVKIQNLGVPFFINVHCVKFANWVSPSVIYEKTSVLIERIEVATCGVTVV